MTILVTIPVFNEEEQLRDSIAQVHTFLKAQTAFEYEILIADNGSTDQTIDLARGLAREYAHVAVSHLDLRGRGRALKTAWNGSAADILSYMDVDLSTDLAAFPELVGALASGQYDIAIGSRLDGRAQTVRGWRREMISRCYNRLVKWLFQTHFSDAQCGFKAITREAARRLLPFIGDPGWFFDTELLVIAEKRGFRIFDLPVRWIDDADSRVRILSTAWADLKGLARLRWNLIRGAYDTVSPARRAPPAEEVKAA